MLRAQAAVKLAQSSLNRVFTMPKPNDRIGPYQLISKLGKGSFAEAWLARKTDARDGRKVALKIPLADELDVDALLQEATLWARATGHENVLEFIEARFFDQQAVIISEYAPGGSMEQWLNERGGTASSVAEALEMTRGILAGLEYLHGRNIIHRDLKPANILLQDATPRIADFGLSRVVKTSIHSKVIAGTWAYMAPEAFKAVRNEQTDLWSVAVILYQMLAGRLPFWAEDRPSLMDVIRTREPKPLPATTPDWLQDVLAKALQKNAAERYASATQLREALTPPVPAPPPPRPTSPPPKPVAPTTQIDPTTLYREKPQPRPEPVKPPGPRPVEPKPQPERLVPVLKPEPPTPQSDMPKSLKAVIGLGLIGALSGFIYWASNRTSITTTTDTPATVQPANASASKDFTETVNGVKLEMKAVPAGSFLMGSPASEVQRDDDEGQHRVTVSAFAIGKHEITQAQWQAVMGNNNNPSNFKGANRPVENVSWNDAKEFCQKLSQLTGKAYRLPTEAEWEYAARAGTTTPFAFGSSLSSTQANFDGNYPYGGAAKGVYRAQTTEVGSFAANAFGLFDMHGNVWEWCQDWYGPYGTGAQNNPTGPTTGEYRVLRGGSWYSNSWNCRAAYRKWNAPGDRNYDIGFRVVQVSRTP
jgi:formylglycine-generating enzyme required for sulfatase activity/tRNA A-37 threonylcarbamoyl transferase component Bud32